MTAVKLQQIQAWESAEAEYSRLCDELIRTCQAGDYFTAGRLAGELFQQSLRTADAMAAVAVDAAAHLTVGEVEVLEQAIDRAVDHHATLHHKVGEWLPQGR